MPEHKKYAVQIKSLSYKYPSSSHLSQPTPELKLALKDIAFKVKEGEKVSIIGPNGAGKSIFLLNIAGLMDGEYRKGDISIFEKP